MNLKKKIKSLKSFLPSTFIDTIFMILKSHLAKMICSPFLLLLSYQHILILPRCGHPFIWWQNCKLQPHLPSHRKPKCGYGHLRSHLYPLYPVGHKFSHLTWICWLLKPRIEEIIHLLWTLKNISLSLVFIYIRDDFFVFFETKLIRIHKVLNW